MNCPNCGYSLEDENNSIVTKTLTLDEQFELAAMTPTCAICFTENDVTRYRVGPIQIDLCAIHAHLEVVQ